MNMIQRQLGVVPSIVRKEDKAEYIQSLVDSHENEDSTIVQDVLLRHHIANLNRRVLQYQENDTITALNDTVNIGNDTVNTNTGTVSVLKKSLLKVYNEILRNPEITHAEMMETLHISESTAKRATRDLRNLGYISRSGSDKTGRWIILK